MKYDELPYLEDRHSLANRIVAERLVAFEQKRDSAQFFLTRVLYSIRIYLGL